MSVSLPVTNITETVRVRGIPVGRMEVIQFEQKFGGMLFDESNMSTRAKKIACANAIVVLDKQLRTMQELKGDADYLPDSVDIGDVSWLYIPVGFKSPVETITIHTPRTKKFLAGIVGWFRIRKHIAIGGL